MILRILVFFAENSWNSRWPPAAILNISNWPIFFHGYPILSFCTLFKLNKNTLKKTYTDSSTLFRFSPWLLIYYHLKVENYIGHKVHVPPYITIYNTFWGMQATSFFVMLHAIFWLLPCTQCRQPHGVTCTLKTYTYSLKLGI